jgi:hypothetical protein
VRDREDWRLKVERFIDIVISSLVMAAGVPACRSVSVCLATPALLDRCRQRPTGCAACPGVSAGCAVVASPRATGVCVSARRASSSRLHTIVALAGPQGRSSRRLVVLCLPRNIIYVISRDLMVGGSPPRVLKMISAASTDWLPSQQL